MTFPAYPNYKSTGVEWLSEIPVHWELIRLRFLLLDGAEGIKIGPFGSQLTSDMLVEVGYKVYGQENVIAGDFDKGRRYITDEKFSEMSVYEIRPNDLLVTMMGTAGRCKVVPEAISAGVMDSHLLRMRFGQKADPKFVELLIDKSNYVSHQVRLNGKGSIMHGLNSSIIKELLVALPSADEQAPILSFLDHETARIDALIEEQQRLIELLKEKRQAVISHAVTKGLDPAAPMKHSGVEWLGEVPAHWRAVRLRHCLVDALTYGANEPSDEANLEHPRYIRITDLNDDGTLSAETYKSLPPEKAEPYMLEEGDVLFARSGATVGKSFLYSREYGPACYAGYLIRARVNKRTLIPMYLWMCTQSRQYEQFIGESNIQATIQNVSAEKYGNMWIALPEIEEQEKILAELEIQLSQFKSLMETSVGALVLLQERRSALISAAITGKIDVRGWQPPVDVQAPALVQETV
ncbi:restriction endonuclease subunit S [Halopseudomonas aestusnigri]|uniref:restriction endonuclease subunit S n=1 Tax=Halopseudomonas aestusnigri TaxID=857252 RepID=UPI0028C366DF|nr:restriction endonuclease subunit S [Halopseudomonas aestusnigri]